MTRSGTTLVMHCCFCRERQSLLFVFISCTKYNLIHLRLMPAQKYYHWQHRVIIINLQTTTTSDRSHSSITVAITMATNNTTQLFPRTKQSGGGAMAVYHRFSMDASYRKCVICVCGFCILFRHRYSHLSKTLGLHARHFDDANLERTGRCFGKGTWTYPACLLQMKLIWQHEKQKYCSYYVTAPTPQDHHLDFEVNVPL